MTEKRLALFFTLYFAIGLFFAFAFAIFYRWPTLGYFSPGFYIVIISWPIQAIGFLPDLYTYGFAGKPI